MKMLKAGIFVLVAGLSGSARANLILDVNNMPVNGTSQIVGSNLTDISTGQSTTVTMNGQGIQSDEIQYSGTYGYGVNGGNPWTAALNDNEVLTFSFTKNVTLHTLNMHAFTASEAFAWWIGAGSTNVVQGSSAGSAAYSLGDVNLLAGQSFHVQAYADGSTYPDTRGYFKSLDVSVIPEPATLGLVGALGVGMFLIRRLFAI